jgi:DNA-binding GntR family transcriptional regulator
MAAVLERDADLACRLMADHLKKTTDILLAAPFLDTSATMAGRKSAR